MPESGVILEHHGHINLSVIELLLDKLKKESGFSSLSNLIRKRTYSVLAECLENIYMHSAILSKKNKILQPYISVVSCDDKIVIATCNPILSESKNKLSHNLDEINELNRKELKARFKDIISLDMNHEKNGAGLGLISMKMRSERNEFEYRFSKIFDDYLNFELRITINK